MKLRPLALALVLLLAPAAHAVDHSRAWQRSYDLESQGGYEDALTALYAVPTQARSYTWELRRGWLLYLDGEHDLAVGAYQAAVRAQPSAVEPRLGLLLPQLADRRWKDAEATARSVLRLDADNATATGRLAWALYNLGRYAEAERQYHAALRAYPADVDLRAGLGWSQLMQDRAAEARATFQEVLDIAPEHRVAGEGMAAVGGQS
jgi:tetratricopeptide (TPR) repeat protein